MLFAPEEKSFIKKVVLVILLITLAYIIYQLKTVILLFFLSVFISYAIQPLVQALERIRVRRSLATMFVFLLIFSLAFFIIWQLSILVTYQTKLLTARIKVQGLPFFLEQILIQYWDIGNIVTTLQDYSKEIIQYLPRLFMNFFNLGFFIAYTLILFVMVFFFLRDREAIETYILSFIRPTERREKIRTGLRSVEDGIGRWLRAQVIIGIIMAAFLYIPMKLIQIKFALTFAIIISVIYIIPYLWMVGAGVIAIFILATYGLIYMLGFLAYVVALNFVEMKILIPTIMREKVGVNELATICGLISFGIFFGVLGMLVAVPMVNALKIILETVRHPAPLAEPTQEAALQPQTADEGCGETLHARQKV
ncbi:MAG: AI-2E family transporter [Deltaproteobacteria bacterium]|nr:AI-2E family transporter [Deltaproteobacteria bacterium]MBW2307457.1 AI-2E family transporter [Deltaproteobacteria bacterium]